MQTNIAGLSAKVNYFEADLILANHRIRDFGERELRLAARCEYLPGDRLARREC